jgi:hypothetical protein
MQEQSRLGQQLMKQPDLPHWYKQRQNVVLALGDRVFEKPFDEVFNAVIIALGSLEVKVDNVERESGYLAATGMMLSPELGDKLRRDQLVEYCRHYGHDPSLLDAKGKYNIDPDMVGGMMQSMGTGLTVVVLKQDETKTKVKMRFKGVIYPRTLEECYRVVWPRIDKQVFMDKSLD